MSLTTHTVCSFQSLPRLNFRAQVSRLILRPERLTLRTTRLTTRTLVTMASSVPTIAIVAPGSMGAAVALRFTKSGVTVLTPLAGRSPATLERAKAAGMVDATLEEIAERAQWVLSILPPSSALAFAESFKKAHKSTKLTFVDCNAVSPETVKRIARVFQGSPVRFVDAGIVGGPPTDKYDPAFYASVDPADADLLEEFIALGKLGLRVVPLTGEGAGIGDASALKMSYAVGPS